MAIEKVIPYPRGPVGDYDGILQRKPWDCGEAAVQAIAASAGVYRTEDWIINKVNSYVKPHERVDEDGTDHAGLLCPVLNELLPGSGYKAVWVPNHEKSHVEEFWKNAKRSIDANRPVLLNFEAPPGNPPKASRGSVPPPYPRWTTTYHYTLGPGYAVDSDGSRHIWVGDSAGFGGITGWWCPLEDVVRLIVPHAYAYAADAPIVIPPTPAPTPAPTPQKPEINKLEILWQEWNAFAIEDLEAIGAIVQKAKAGDARSIQLLSKLEKYAPSALQAYINRKA